MKVGTGASGDEEVSAVPVGGNIVMAYVVMAYIVMAYIIMAYVVMAYIVMAYLVMADAVMAYMIMPYIVGIGTGDETVSAVPKEGNPGYI